MISDELSPAAHGRVNVSVGSLNPHKLTVPVKDLMEIRSLELPRGNDDGAARQEEC